MAASPRCVTKRGPRRVELWESNSICRYLCLLAGGDACGLYPTSPGARASVERWLDWQLSTLSPAERDLFWGMVRTPEGHARHGGGAARGERERRLLEHPRCAPRDGRAFLEGEALTLADIVLGAFAGRWYGEEARVEGMPDFPALAAWYARLGERPGFARWVAPQLF
jgi:glutathione S-transferase